MSTIADQLYKAAESAASMAGGGGDDNAPSSGGMNYDWSVTFEDPAAPGGRRTSQYSIPAGSTSEFYDAFVAREEDQGMPLKRFEMVPGRMSPRDVSPPLGERSPLPSSSFDPAQAVRQAGGTAAQTAGAAAVTPQGTTTATTGAVPGQEAPEEQRRRGRSSWEAPGEAVQFTQEDFYPNPQDPFAGQYSTGVEYVARQGRMPMGALSKAAAALQDRQLQLDQKRQEFIDDLYKPIKTASPYQQNFNAIVNKQREDFVKSVADAYTGGDVNKAYREIFASPQLRNQWRQINADLEALGQRGGEIFARAEKYLADAATNTIGSTPEMRKLARDIMYGMGGYASPDGTGGDFNTLVKNIKQFEMMEGRDRYFRDTVTKSVKDFFEQDPNIIRTDTGRYIFLTEQSRKHWTSHISQLARDMAIYQGYGDGADLAQKIKDNETFLNNMLGDQIEQRTDVIDKYKGMGGGGAGDGAGGASKVVYQHGITARNPSEEVEGGTLYWMELARRQGADLGVETSGIDEISLMGTTAGESRAMKPKPIAGQNIIPISFFRDAKGRMWLRGKVAGEPGVRKKTDPKTKKTTLETITPEELSASMSRDPYTGEVTYTQFELLKDAVIPFYDTSGDITLATGGWTASSASQYIDQQRAARGGGQRTATGQQSSTQQQPAAGKSDITEAEYAKLKKGEKYWFQGKEYTKQ